MIHQDPTTIHHHWPIAFFWGKEEETPKLISDTTKLEWFCLFWFYLDALIRLSTDINLWRSTTDTQN